MLRKIVVFFSTLSFAFIILAVSIMRTASVRYIFSDVTSNGNQFAQEVTGEMAINYYLAYPGPVSPGHLLWPLKVSRDNVWLFVTANTGKKAELNLLFADKRLGAAKMLFEKGKPELGFVTLLKSQKYFEESCRLENQIRRAGGDTGELADRLVNASLKHRQVIREIIDIAPDDAIPEIIIIEDFLIKVYHEKSEVLKVKQMPVPKNPFNGG